MRRRWTPAALALAALLGPPGEARALGLRSSFKELVVEGLEPGRARKVPLKVENAGGETVELEMRLEPPGEAELKDGYEPLPDPSWARLTETSRSLRAGAAAQGAAVVQVPGGRSGRWQAQWVSVGRTPEGLKLELRSSLLLRTAGPPRPPGSKSARRATYVLKPDKGRAEEAVLGRDVDLRREHGVALKLANLGERKERFALAVEESPPEGLEAEGFPPAPDPSFLRVEPAALDVEPGTIAEAALTLRVPDQARYRRRRWSFVVSAEPLEAAGRKAYFRLLVTTGGQIPGTSRREDDRR